ncbi:uncharacterized protein B0J16DRAFT_45269 [Fusarium flagelliforme]|uniref:uncharacterized protein n=1 Tax=Fusarium flagelliforme TaxID=2675880 RepID=UPI001E8EA787|nr:uncharacterized protein B0J16DRAFT_45269 [Fusarium flagelliforme]KAH7198755.1 hypothetical protein B0J16DRAFT_45269 [Fusarium flagelliforme]
MSNPIPSMADTGPTMQQLGTLVAEADHTDDKTVIHFRHVIVDFKPQPSGRPAAIFPIPLGRRQDLIKQVFDEISECKPRFAMTQGILGLLLRTTLPALESFVRNNRNRGRQMLLILTEGRKLCDIFITTGIPGFDAGETEERIQSIVNHARYRDLATCIVTRVGGADMAHIWPFWATSSVNYTKRNLTLFNFLALLVGDDWMDVLRPKVSGVRMTEVKENLFALGQIVHGWTDKACCAFQFLDVEQVVGTEKWNTVLKFHFFPSPCEIKAAATWPAVEAMIQELETLFRREQARGLQARAPKEDYSAGYVGAYLPKGERLQSGQLFTITHDNEEDAKVSGTFFEGHWFCMSVLALGAGVKEEISPEERKKMLEEEKARWEKTVVGKLNTRKRKQNA